MIDPNDIRWRVANVFKNDATKAQVVAYIDARTAMEHLDNLDAGWSDDYKVVDVDGKQGVQCSLTVNGVTRTDVGVPSNMEGLKGAYSDALKRAAVKHGIGRELYEMPRIVVSVDQYKRPIATPVFANGRWSVPNGKGTVHYDDEPAINDAPNEPATLPPQQQKRQTAPAKPTTPQPQTTAGPDPEAAADNAARKGLWEMAQAAGVSADEIREKMATIMGESPVMKNKHIESAKRWLHEAFSAGGQA